MISAVSILSLGDLGCGTGLELEEYYLRCPSAKVTGIDLSQGMLSALRKKFANQDITVVVGSYFDMPFGENVFDAAVSVESLHRQNFVDLKAEQGIHNEEFYHYDTPLTVEHEAEALLEAGFSNVEVLNHWGATYTLKAVQ